MERWNREMGNGKPILNTVSKVPAVSESLSVTSQLDRGRSNVELPPPTIALPAYDRFRSQGPRSINIEKFRARAQATYEELYRYVATPVEGSFAPFPPSVPKLVADILTRNGERTPWVHQAEVARLSLDEGKNVSLTTPTASGKTVSFLAPTLSILARDFNATAMFLYPMNALTHDQAKGLGELGFMEDADNGCIHRLQLGEREVVTAVMNGDTPQSARPQIRREVDLMLTNPVALHTSILQKGGSMYKDQSSWARFLKNLKLIVVDEAHTQHGVGGSNTALALRRLMAQIEYLGGKPPRIILSTATIANAKDHAEALTGQGNWAFVNRSGAKTQERTYIVCRPADHPKGDGRWSPTVVAENLAVMSLLENRRVLVFCNTRSKTETMATRINDSFGQSVVLPFHAAIPSERKTEFTDRILNGRVRGVACTSVLQMGVDIGGMDDCIIMGFPGDDFSALAQMAGRVGRTSPGRVFLVLDDNQGAMNTYLESYPKAIHGEPQSRTLYPENENLALTHAACALLETRSNLSLVKKWFPGVDIKDALRRTTANPHASVDMLGSMGEMGQFQGIAPDQKEVLQELGGRDALLNWHIGASIRSAMGETYMVSQVDLAARRVLTEPLMENVYRYTTTPIRNRLVTALDTAPAPEVKDQLRGMSSAVVGSFNVSQQTREFRAQVWYRGDDGPVRPERVPVLPDQLNPPVEFKTRGLELILDASNPLAQAFNGALSGDSSDMCAALADVMSKTVPSVVQARPQDVDIEIESLGTTARVMFFDMAVGGMGWSESLGGRLRDWFTSAFHLLKNCNCSGQGCPRCTLSPMKADERDELVYGLEQLTR